jgi:predicted Zn-dependent protease
MSAAVVSGVALVSVEEEVAIGQQADAQVRKQMAVLKDAPADAYVRRLGARLVAAAPGPKYPYSFAVANYREINAFALPGGPVWVHRGAMQRAARESELAGVLAHEVAHVAQRHAAEQLTKVMVARWGLGLLGAVLGNTGGAGPAQAAAGLLADGVFLRFSREDEEEADRVGLRILTDAGWDGRGMEELLERLRKEAAGEPTAAEVFFSTHPSPGERLAHLRADPASRIRGRRDSAEFRRVRAHLAMLAPAQPLPAAR